MPGRESGRLQAVKRILELELTSKKQIQDIILLVAEICEVPIVLITLIDADVQHFKAKLGLEINQTTREASFCQYTISSDADIMIIPDSLLDKRFVNNPLVTGDPKIRFYAGAPLETQDGYKLGSLCIIDHKPKDLTEQQQELLKMLSRQVINIMELEMTIDTIREQNLAEQNLLMKLKSFFESPGTAHILIGHDEEVIAYNKAAKDYIAALNGEYIQSGEPFGRYISDDFNLFFHEHFKDCLQGGNVFAEREFNYDHDVKMWWEISMNPLYSEDLITGVSINVQNITDRKKHEQMIIKQNTTLQKIAQIQSHDFRRPIANIIGLMDLIKKNNYDDCTEYLKILERAIAELDIKNNEVVLLSQSLS